MLNFILAALLVNIPLALSPGPTNILCLSIAVVKGFKGTLKFIVGLQVLPFLYSLIITFGAVTVLTKYENISFIIKIIGSLYMIYLAISMISSKSMIDKKDNIKSSFLYGVLAQGLNPKNIAIIITVYSLFAVEAKDYHYGIILAIVITLCNLISHLLWAGMANFMIKSPLMKYQDKIFGILLVLATLLLWI